MYGRKPRYTKKSRRPMRKRGMRTRRRRVVNVNKALQPFAQRYITKLRYVGNFALSTVNIPYVYALNSIFDPDVSGTGHQPYGHDQLAAMYNRYRVYAVKYHIRCQPLDGSNQYLIAVPINQPFVAASFDDAREKPRSKYILQTQGGDSRPLINKLSLPSLTGKTRAQYMSDDRYQAPFGSDPVENMQLQIYSYNAGGLTTSASARCTIELTYYIECFDPNVLNQS